jgi:hypothetical protein
VIGLSLAVELARRDRPGVAMFGVCFAAIAAAALLGWPRRSLTVVGVGVAAIVWLVLLGVIGEAGLGSAIAHFLGGALVGWALADAIRRTPGARADARRVFAAAVLATLVVGIVWELWEWGTDAVIGTSLSGDIADTALDLISDCAGAAAGAALAVSRLPRPAERAPRGGAHRTWPT